MFSCSNTVVDRFEIASITTSKNPDIFLFDKNSNQIIFHSKCWIMNMKINKKLDYVNCNL